jgi:FkbM family methyltransferase
MKKKALSKLIALIKKLDQKLWPTYFYVITDAMAKVLTEKTLVIVDVGAAMGVDARWQPAESLIQFVTFEPDTRSQDYATTARTVNFATGLSAEKGRKALHMTTFAPASSLYPLNMAQLQDFANREWHESAGSIPIEVDTLNNCLADRPDLRPDFMKVDVEGADLDVLKGASDFLDTTLMGLQIEVSFIERHKGAPFFGETDAFMREHGFALFILSREHWLRHNLVYGANSNPQLIWGDAVYFLKRDQLLERLRTVSSEDKTLMLSKFIAILLGYGAHDYAVEVIDAAFSAKLVSEAIANDLKKAVTSSVVNPTAYFFRCLSGVIFAVFIYLLSAPIGALRRRSGAYLKKRMANLLHHLSKSVARGGIYDSCISDHH